ncbi:MAG: hypothetical protein RR782_02770 [Clostridium sp.]
MLEGAKVFLQNGLVSVFGFLWNGLYTSSYAVFLSIAMFSLVMYVAGCKSFAKVVPASIIIYTLIRAIGRF